MIRNVHIENFKSIEALDLELGRFNVLIGDNGSGKTNLLEALAFASAASQERLDDESLAEHGVRVTEPRFMQAAFASSAPRDTIGIELSGDDSHGLIYKLKPQDDPGTLARWVDTARQVRLQQYYETAMELLEAVSDMFAQTDEGKNKAAELFSALESDPSNRVPSFDFAVYAPERSVLRASRAESTRRPLGIRGEGLFAHLRDLGAGRNRMLLEEIVDRLCLFGWFDRLALPASGPQGAPAIRIRDRWLPESALFAQQSANDTFLLLLFYFTLVISPETPRIFAIDDLDAGLVPALGSALITHLAELSRKHDKQVLVAVHGPATLDGLDLRDEEQRLFSVYRNRHGHTRARRLVLPAPVEGEMPIRLSEAYLLGAIGRSASIYPGSGV
jgi:predicted ATPase